MRHLQFKKPAGERRHQANDSPALASAPRLGLRASGEGFFIIARTRNRGECHERVYESEVQVADGWLHVSRVGSHGVYGGPGWKTGAAATATESAPHAVPDPVLA